MAAPIHPPDQCGNLNKADYDNFNRVATDFLNYLRRKLKGDKAVVGAINGLELAKRSNYKLPCTEYFHAVQGKVILAIQRNDRELFLTPAYANVVPVLKDIDYAYWGPRLDDHTKKNIWKYIRKLTRYAGFPVSEEERQAFQESLARAAEDRQGPSDETAAKFNAEYDYFLENMAIAFPPQTADPNFPRQVFAEMVRENPKQVAREFKAVSLEFLPLIMNHDPSFLQTPHHVRTLPLMQYYPLDQYWQESMKDENADTIFQSLTQLVLCISGVSNIDPNFLASMEVHAERMAAKIDIDPSTMNQSDLMKMAGGMLQSMQKDSDDGLRGIMQAFAPGGAMAKKFDSDMLKGIMSSVDMEVLGPLMGGLEGMMSGSTGAPAFGSMVERPAWLNSENDDK